VKLSGGASQMAGPLMDEVSQRVLAGRPVLLWSDGVDVTALLGGQEDTAEDVARMAPRVLDPGLWS